MSSLLANDMYGLRGKALSVAEATAIQASLVVLSERHNFARANFWGKIYGYQGDYYIAEVLTNPEQGIFGPRVPFYSVDGGVNWVPLPSLTADQIDFSEQLRGRFIGQPDFQYKIRRDVPPEPEVAPELPSEEPTGNEDDEEADGGAEEEKEEGDAEGQQEAVPEGDEAAEGEDKAPKKQKPKFQIISMPESCRVAHFVAVHNGSCLVVPRGAFVLKPGNVIAKNRTFAGLDTNSAQKLSSFVHVSSKPRDNISDNAATYGPNFNATTDFFVPLVEDRPEGVWSLQYDATVGAVSLENLLFEGSLFFHKVGTTEYGQVYFGTGERNLDLCFVLP